MLEGPGHVLGELGSHDSDTGRPAGKCTE